MADRRSHDPFAPAASRPRSSTAETTLADWARDRLRAAGATDEEVGYVDLAFGQADRRARGSLLRGLRSAPDDEVEMLVQELRLRLAGQEGAPGTEQEPVERTPAEVAVDKWVEHMVEAGDDPVVIDAAIDQLEEIGAWLTEQDDVFGAWGEIDALVGGDGPHKVATYDGAIAAGLTHDEAMAVAYPEVGDEESPAGDVPAAAPDIIEWIGDDTARAEVALAAEVGRSERRRRNTVLAKVNEVLPPERVAAITAAVEGG